MFGNIQQLTPEQQASKKQAILQALANPPTTMGGGLGQLGAGIASHFVAPVTGAPQTAGKGKPGFGMLLSNMFRGGAR